MEKATIIVAGGSGRRLGGPVPKQFQTVKGRPLLMWTIEVFHRYDPAMPLIVVLPKEHFDIWKALCMGHRFFIEHQVVAGGEERFHSVKAGLEKVQGDPIIAVHDGVRPIVSAELIARCFDEAEAHGTAIPAVPIAASVREVDISAPAGMQLSRPLDRTRLRTVQTPQCFRAEFLRKAYALPYDAAFTDDATLVERIGEPMHLVNGEEHNIKVTTEVDMYLVETLLAQQV